MGLRARFRDPPDRQSTKPPQSWPPSRTPSSWAAWLLRTLRSILGRLRGLSSPSAQPESTNRRLQERLASSAIPWSSRRRSKSGRLGQSTPSATGKLLDPRPEKLSPAIPESSEVVHILPKFRKAALGVGNRPKIRQALAVWGHTLADLDQRWQPFDRS